MNFWVRRLEGQPSQAPAQQHVLPPVQPPVPAVPAVSQQPRPQGHEQVPLGVLLSQQEYQTARAASAKQNDHCPDCGGSNYLGVPGQPRIMKQCADCGYNERFLHSTHGVTGIGQNLPTRAARAQTQAPPGAPPMNSIVGRV